MRKSKNFIIRSVGTGGLLVALTIGARASALSEASFNQLAFMCAPGVSTSTLKAVALVESHLNPLALRDNTSNQRFNPATLSLATALASERLKRGHSLDLGLMQINSTHLASLQMGLREVFDPCKSLAAASEILLTYYSTSSTEAERQAAILIALSRYNTGRPLAGITNGYAGEVISAQHSDQPTNMLTQDQSKASPSWDIWGKRDANPAHWLIMTDRAFRIERAGAQTSDARSEGRAPEITSEKGEPYELSAYQESMPPKP